MRLLPIILFCAALLFISGCSGKKSFSETDFEATVEKAHRAKNPELILAYLNATRSVPEVYKANAYIQLGLISEEIKEDENAERYFEKALSSIGQEKGQIPTLIKCTALYESAKIYSRRKDYSKSIYYYRQFLSEYKTNPSFKVNLANVYLDLSFCAMFLKKYSYQKEVLLKALKIQIENENNTPLIVAGTYIFLSSSCCNLEEYDEALTWSQKALTICNKNNKDHNHAIAMANFYKAQALYGKKKKAKAIATMQQAFNGLKKSIGPDNNKTILAGKFLAQWQNR